MFPESPSGCSGIRTYDATFPSSIILNITDDFIVSRNHNEIEIKKTAKTFSIIDGQHRLEGFRNYKNDDFEVIVSIFINLSKELQSRIFTTINSEQTKVDPSISLYLERNDSLYTPRKVVAQIASTFSTDIKSPWNGKIKLTGRKDDYSYDGIISLSAFAKPILNYIYPDDDFYLVRNALHNYKSIEVPQILQRFDYSSKYILWPFYATQNDKALYKILYNYFSAFKTTFKNDWGNARSLLTKTTGYNAIMLLFKDLFTKGYCNGNLSEEFFLSCINKLKGMEGKIDSYTYGASGLKSSNDLYEDFKSLIEI